MASQGESIARPVRPELVREQLERIVASRYFSRSERLTRFLRFSVEHALNGTSDQVKEYLVGVEVFDRRQSFDPRVDPIVRVEARRLRAKLKSYYATIGRADPVFIDFPKGAYTPVFEAGVAGQTVASTPHSALQGIAVLPFTNLTNANDDYFSDGLTEELIYRLTRVPGLRVVAWSSAAQMRGYDQDLRAVAERLNVDRLLRGSVRRTDSRIRVTVQLLDAASGAYLWSESYDRAFADLLAIQDEIARAIVSTLHGTLTPAAATPVPNAESYNLCLRGRYQANQRTEAGLLESVESYQAAIDADDSSALAYAGLADSYNLLADYSVIAPAIAIPLARAAAERALELDPGSAEACCSMAYIRSRYEWQWDAAEALYRQAIERNPGYAVAHHWYSVDFLAVRGRLSEARPELDIALRLDPLSLIVHEGDGYLRLIARDYAGALEVHERIVRMDPHFYKAYSSGGRALIQLGRYDEAIAMLTKARSLSGDVPNITAALGQAFGLAGRREEARACLADLKEMATRRYVAGTCHAIVHLGLGERQEALEWIERAAAIHDFPVAAIKVHPVYDPLREDPAFKRLIARLGL